MPTVSTMARLTTLVRRTVRGRPACVFCPSAFCASVFCTKGAGFGDGGASGSRATTGLEREEGRAVLVARRGLLRRAERLTRFRDFVCFAGAVACSGGAAGVV